MSGLFSAFDDDSALVQPTKRLLDLLFDAFDEDGEGQLQCHDWERLVRAALVAQKQKDEKRADVTVARNVVSSRARELARRCDWNLLQPQTEIRKENFRIAAENPMLEKLLTTPIIQLMLHNRLADAMVKHQSCMQMSIEANCERATLEVATATRAASRSAEVLATSAVSVELAAATVARYKGMYETTARGLDERRRKFYDTVDHCVDKLIAALDTVQVRH